MENYLSPIERAARILRIGEYTLKRIIGISGCIASMAVAVGFYTIAAWAAAVFFGLILLILTRDSYSGDTLVERQTDRLIEKLGPKFRAGAAWLNAREALVLALGLIPFATLCTASVCGSTVLGILLFFALTAAWFWLLWVIAPK